ncbi:MAG TPA: hypothetical protein VLO10_03855, partial [Candidatus Deferrimicrobium sp.]|nr:hypothetical protein [Candidatus Deferrimicrobium sp.]
PRNNSCGHLDNSTGITGAAPIWNADMRAALAGTKASWYTQPKDVIQVGSGGDNADFFLPGTQNGGSVGGGCSYWGPAASPIPEGLPPDCRYTGTRPPGTTAVPSPAGPVPTDQRVPPTLPAVRGRSHKKP